MRLKEYKRHTSCSLPFIMALNWQASLAWGTWRGNIHSMKFGRKTSCAHALYLLSSSTTWSSPFDSISITKTVLYPLSCFRRGILDSVPNSHPRLSLPAILISCLPWFVHNENITKAPGRPWHRKRPLEILQYDNMPLTLFGSECFHAPSIRSVRLQVIALTICAGSGIDITASSGFIIILTKMPGSLSRPLQTQNGD